MKYKKDSVLTIDQTGENSKKIKVKCVLIWISLGAYETFGEKYFFRNYTFLLVHAKLSVKKDFFGNFQTILFWCMQNFL